MGLVNGSRIGYISRMGTDKPVINFTIEPALLRRVEDFWHKHRFPTRAAAIKWLLAWALDQKPVPKGE